MSPSRRTTARHLVAGCDLARTITSKFPGRDDLVIGPLSYAGLEYFANRPMQEQNWNGGHFYKSGAQLRPGLSSTVAIAEKAKAYAAIVTENAPTGGAHSVADRSCSKPAAGKGSAWIGGFVLWNRESACVPIEVTTPHHPIARRVVVSLGARACP